MACGVGSAASRACTRDAPTADGLPGPDENASTTRCMSYNFVLMFLVEWPHNALEALALVKEPTERHIGQDAFRLVENHL